MVMFKATRAIYDALSHVDGLKVFTDESDKLSSVWLQFGLKSGGNYRIRFISTDDGNDVSVRVIGLIRVEANQRADIINVLNELNRKYRYVKFVCDNDNDINVEYDFPTSASNPAESALEMVLRVAKIIEEAYPEIMRTLWS